MRSGIKSFVNFSRCVFNEFKESCQHRARLLVCLRRESARLGIYAVSKVNLHQLRLPHSIVKRFVQLASKKGFILVSRVQIIVVRLIESLITLLDGVALILTLKARL